MQLMYLGRKSQCSIKLMVFRFDFFFFHILFEQFLNELLIIYPHIDTIIIFGF